MRIVYVWNRVMEGMEGEREGERESERESARERLHIISYSIQAPR